MNPYSRWIWVTLFGVFVLGCATQAPLGPILNPAERLEFDGFSVLPPQGKNWYLGKSPYYGVVFMKRLFETPRSPEMHSFYARVTRDDLKGKVLETPQDLLSFVEWTIRGEPRFRVVNSNVVLDNAMGSAMGTDCARYDGLLEERDNPIAPEAVLILRAHGFQCRHPSSPRVVIDAGCSERYPQGEQSLLDESLEQECESFLRSVLLKPLRSLPASAQIGTTSTPSAWEPAYWDQMMLAVKSAREHGDKLEAEGLCFRAIPYVEAQAVKALRDYAELLDSQQAGSGADTRTKAERLAQVKAQQAQATLPGRSYGNSYLGFVVWDELNGYADSLHEAQRESDSQAMRVLAAAYKYSQEVHVRRTLLMHEGKDPRGEC